jgi:shikimate kinase
VLEAHARDRYPAFQQADIVVETGDAAHQIAVDSIVAALAAHSRGQPCPNA